MAKPAYYEDAWLQAFAVMALVSGLYTALGLRNGAYGAAALPSLKPPALALPSAPQGGAALTGLAALLAAAGPGDTITLPPGTYEGPFEVAKPVTLRGGGAVQGDVVIAGTGPKTLLLSAGSLTLENLSVENKGGSGASAIAAPAGALELKNVRVRSDGNAVWAGGADLHIVNSMLLGRVALVAEGRTRGTLSTVGFMGSEAGVLAGGSEVDLIIDRSQVRASEGTGLAASRFARIRMNSTSILSCKSSGILAMTGADVKLSHGQLRDNQGCGVRLGEAQVSLEDVVVNGNLCGVGFIGSGVLLSNNSRYLNLNLGAIAVKPGLADKITVKGAGNYGLSATGPGAGGSLP